MIFFNYVLRRFLKNTLSIYLVCLLIYVLFDFIQRNTRYFSKHSASLINVVEYYLYQTPSIFLEVMPVAVLLGSVISVIMLARTNEVTAMRAAGGGLSTLAGPLFVGAIAISALLFFVMEVILPTSTRYFHDVKKVKIEEKTSDAINFTKTWLRSGNHIYNYSRYDPILQIVHDLRIDILSEQSFSPIRTIRASKAIASPDSNTTSIWRLENADVFIFNQSNQLIGRNFHQSFPFRLPIQPREMQSNRDEVSDFSISELYEMIEQGKSRGVGVKELEMEMHQKTSILALVLIVSLIGLRFSFFFERNTEVVFGVLTAVFIGMSYWLILGTTKALSANGIIVPLWACWLPNFILIFIVGIDLRIAKRGI